MYHTTWERLWKAVHSLATGTESIQNRLTYALMALVPLRQKEFPLELQKPFSNLFDRVDAVENPGARGAIRVFTDGLSDEDASKIAENIVEWFDTVAREHCSGD